MCAHHGTQGPKSYKLLFLYLIAISFGLYSGLGSVPFLESLGHMVSEVFIKIFKCISLPMISLSLIVTLSNLSRKGHMRSLWKRVLLYSLTTTLVAAALSCVLYILIRPENISVVIHTAAPLSQNSSSYFRHLEAIIPANLLSPFMEHQVMGVLLISLTLGVAIRSIPEEKPREAISQIFKGAHSLFLVIFSESRIRKRANLLLTYLKERLLIGTSRSRFLTLF